jgi:anaerobic magnesium-protoporphyrin IX monomethyl ester cyclase
MAELPTHSTEPRRHVVFIDPLQGQGKKKTIEINIPGRDRYTGSPVGIKDPIALQYIAAYLEERGYETTVMLKALMDDEEIIRRIESIEGYLAGICLSLHSTYIVPGALELARKLKTHFAGITIIVGGYHPTGDPDVVKEDCIDFAVIGEGEASCHEVLEAAESGADLETCKRIPGLAFIDAEGQLVCTPARERLHFAEMHWPKREAEILDLCHPGPLSYPPVGRVAQVSYSRGCPYGCTFCASVGMWKRKVQHRKAEDMADEMRHLITEYGVNNFFFCDLSFNGNGKRLLELCDAVEALSHEVDVDFGSHVMCTSTIIDETILSRMRAGRFLKIDYGIEDILEGTINRIKSFQRIDRIRNTLNATNQHGVLIRGLMMIGYPWESEETVREREELIDQFPVDQLRVCFYTPYKGTPMYEEVKDRIVVDMAGFTTDQPAIRCDGIGREALMDSIPRILKRLYNSDHYYLHIRDKSTAYPDLNNSYWHFFKYLNKKGLMSDKTWKHLSALTGNRYC